GSGGIASTFPCLPRHCRAEDRGVIVIEPHSHRASGRPHWRRRRLPIAVVALTGGLALVFGATAFLATSHNSDPARSAPVDLRAPLGMTWGDLHQWCQDRRKAGTDGLSVNARNWLRGCAEATAPTPDPSATSPSTPAAPATTPPTSTKPPP